MSFAPPSLEDLYQPEFYFRLLYLGRSYTAAEGDPTTEYDASDPDEIPPLEDISD